MSTSEEDLDAFLNAALDVGGCPSDDFSVWLMRQKTRHMRRFALGFTLRFARQNRKTKRKIADYATGNGGRYGIDSLALGTQCVVRDGGAYFGAYWLTMGICRQ